MKIQIIFFLFRSATGKPSAIGLWCKNIHKLNVHTQIEVGKSRKQLQFISWELFTQNSSRDYENRDNNNPNTNTFHEKWLDEVYTLHNFAFFLLNFL